jgi:hypothetical protein
MAPSRFTIKRRTAWLTSPSLEVWVVPGFVAGQKRSGLQQIKLSVGDTESSLEQQTWQPWSIAPMRLQNF